MKKNDKKDKTKRNDLTLGTKGRDVYYQNLSQNKQVGVCSKTVVM
jgi:hypothetical protein